MVPRVADIYAAMPSITGKFELEYEGERRGAERVAHEVIGAAVARAYDENGRKAAGRQIVQWFGMGGVMKLAADAPAVQVVRQLEGIQGVRDAVEGLLPDGVTAPEALASAGEFVLDGLYAHRRLTRSEEVGYAAQREKPRKPRRQTPDLDPDDFGQTFN